MASTNNSAILFGDLLQLGNSVFGAGTTQVSTLTLSGAPAAGGITVKFWGLETALIDTSAGEPSGAIMTAALNLIFGTAYAHPFTVTGPTTHVYTITADTSGPFAYMPLAPFTIGTNTSGVTVTPAISVPGVTKETFATVPGVETMPWPGVTTDIETYLTLDPGTNGFKRKVAKFSDAGTATFTVNMANDATQNAVTGFRYMARQKQVFDWRIVEPTKVVGPGIIIPGSTYYMSAYVSMFKRNGATPDSRQKWDGTLAFDGDVLEFPPIS
jgi:hypothetical protein